MKQLTVNEILNRVALSIGLDESADAFGSTDKSFIQLVSLLQDAGDELVQMYNWEELKAEYNFTTDGSGTYDLPSDFDRMIPQTHWDRTNDLPLGGPLTSQDWQYLLGRDLASSTIYASFRQRAGSLLIFPEANTGQDIYYEYISTNWLEDQSVSPATRMSEIDDGGNVVLYDGTMIRAYLRAKFYEAKGLPTVSAEQVASQFFTSRTGKDTNGQIINAGGSYRGFPYIDGMRNLPDTGYGS